MLTDPLADMLTRIRNALKAKFEKADIPSSRLKVSVANLLKREGYIKDFKILSSDNNKKLLRVFLRSTLNLTTLPHGIAYTRKRTSDLLLTSIQ